MLTAPHVVALGALSTSANAMAGLGQMVLRASSYGGFCRRALCGPNRPTAQNELWGLAEAR
jgi:hypothetical protein